MGYHRAGFDVVGVDIKPQPHYPFEFIRESALYFLEHEELGFDAIHASPPCQHYAGVTAWRGDQAAHPNFVPVTRDLLVGTGLPWVIENVREAPLTGHVLLCGTMLGLPVRRHRHFETSWHGWQMTTPCQHRSSDLAFMHKQERAYADAMGCDWMTAREAREAIPPAYTEFIGARLLEQLAVAA
jgi:DNA (cytosine-5)-methyltransferase 1